MLLSVPRISSITTGIAHVPHFSRNFAASLLCCASSFAHAALPAGFGTDDIRAAAVATFPEYFELLSLPNDSAQPKDIQANVAWLEAAFKKRGFKTRQLENGTRPLLLAEFDGNRPNQKTVLFYMHFDGQPVIPAQWSQESPWKPVVKARGSDGKFVAVDNSRLMRQDFDPELRVFGRSSSDDKGPIMMFLADFDLMKKNQVNPKINVKVILDSQEEVNSPGRPGVVKTYAAQLKADALIIHEAAAHPSGRPTAMFGNRGSTPLTLTVFGPKAPLHSGHYGNYAPNPAQRLANLLASMKGDDGAVLIDGYYSRTTLTAKDRAILAEAGDDEVALRKRIGIKTPERIGGSYQEALQYPSFTIRGMAAAGVGDKVAGIIPSSAVAELDLRSTVESQSEWLVDKVRSHIVKQGYFLSDGEPTDEQRQQHDKIARLKVGLSSEGAQQPIDSPIGKWVYAGLANAYDGPDAVMLPVRLRMMGATVPTHEIVTPLGMPFVLVPVVNADNNQHTFDENLKMNNYLTGMRSMLGLLLQPFP